MREDVRVAILNRFGYDIAKSSSHHQSSLYSFVLDMDDVTIRMTQAQKESRETTMARMMWADDLKLFKDTVCEPIPSKNGNLIEEFQVGKWTLAASMYHTAKGRVIRPDEIRPMFLISAGDMLGTIHFASMDQTKSGLEFMLPSIHDRYMELKDKVFASFNPDVRMRIEKAVEIGESYPKTDETYGVCYGEFDLDNILVDTNNIHLFDFEATLYGHYLYDVAVLMLSALRNGYLKERRAKDVLYKNLIPWFRIGYSMNKHCDETSFDGIEDFIAYRLSVLLMEYTYQTMNEKEHDRKDQIERLITILTAEDVLTGLDIIREKL